MKTNNVILPVIGVKGFITLRKRTLTTTKALWSFPNLLLDTGLDGLLKHNSLDYATAHCVVGIGTTAPLVTDTAIENQVGTQRSGSAIVFSWPSNNVLRAVRTYSFAPANNSTVSESIEATSGTNKNGVPQPVE